jgi:peptidoglycan/xylan/chitin deacetylase (PgdA/CDA1 family)
MTGAVACFTFDNMGEAADVGAGLLAGPRPPGEDPSLAVGYPNLYRLLDRHGVRATFFLEGWNGEHHPDAVAEVVRRGHELGMHGWTHEAWGALAADEEAERAARATAALADAAGVRPVGFRAPGGARTAVTETVLRRLGYRYDASLGDGMTPARLASGLAHVPFRWPCVDGFWWLRPDPVPPAEVRGRWLAALADAAESGGFFLTICHAFITGVDDERLAVLDAVLAAAVADPRVTVRTAGEVAGAVLEREGETT